MTESILQVVTVETQRAVTVGTFGLRGEQGPPGPSGAEGDPVDLVNAIAGSPEALARLAGYSLLPMPQLGLRLPGSDYITGPATPSAGMSGDLDLRVRVAMDDWTPADVVVLASKWVDGQKSWMLWMDPSGKPVLYWSEDGSADKSEITDTATGFTVGADRWLRVKLDVDNGSGGSDLTFWTSTDGDSWSQLGATVTGDPTAIFDSTSPIVLSAPTGPLVGVFYAAQLLDGIDGAPAAAWSSALLSRNTLDGAGSGAVWSVVGDDSTFEVGAA